MSNLLKKIQSSGENSSIIMMTADDLVKFFNEVSANQIKSETPEHLLTTSQAMDLLSIKSRSTLWKMVKEGTITPHRVGTVTRYSKLEILRLAKGGRY